MRASSMVMLLMVPLLAGCTEGPGATDEAGSDDGPPSIDEPLTQAGPNLSSQDCDAMPAAQRATMTVDAGSRYLITPTGGANWGGRVVSFNWSSDPAKLRNLTLTAEWDMTPLTVHLRLGVLNPEATRFSEHWAHGPTNGASPLVLAIDAPRVGVIGPTIKVDLGASQEPGPLGVGTVVLVPQAVRLSVQENYSC